MDVVKKQINSSHKDVQWNKLSPRPLPCCIAAGFSPGNRKAKRKKLERGLSCKRAWKIIYLMLLEFLWPLKLYLSTSRKLFCPCASPRDSFVPIIWGLSRWNAHSVVLNFFWYPLLVIVSSLRGVWMIRRVRDFFFLHCVRTMLVVIRIKINNCRREISNWTLKFNL